MNTIKKIKRPSKVKQMGCRATDNDDDDDKLSFYYVYLIPHKFLSPWRIIQKLSKYIWIYNSRTFRFWVGLQNNPEGKLELRIKSTELGPFLQQKADSPQRQHSRNMT
jgi:hypothetical protein